MTGFLGSYYWVSCVNSTEHFSRIEGEEVEERLRGAHGNKQEREELREAPGILGLCSQGNGGERTRLGENEGSRQQGEVPGTQRGWVCSNSVLSHIFWLRTAILLLCSEPCSFIFSLPPCCSIPVACPAGVQGGRGLWLGSSGHMRDVLGRSPVPQTSLQMV